MQQGITQAIVVPKTTFRPSQAVERIALFTPDGEPVGPTQDTGETLFMTGYADHEAGAVDPGDSANVAIAKLEARIAKLEAEDKNAPKS
jgi:hypothetical protein